MSCLVEGCNNKSVAKNLCNKHYQRKRTHGDVNKVIDRTRKKCSVLGCDKLSFNRGWCPTHHARWRRHGDPLFINPKCNRDGGARQRDRARTAKWKKDNWPAYRAYLNSRKKRIRLATPKWADPDQIRDFYLNCPKGYHVDHIIPVNGKIVSGLHVLANLQYLPAIENLRKGSRF